MRMLTARFLACAVFVLAPALAFGQREAPPGPQGEKESFFKAHELARILHRSGPRSLEVDKQISGLPASSRPEVLTWERVYAMALTRAGVGSAPRGEAVDPKARAGQDRPGGVADFGGFREQFLAARRFDGAGFHDPGGDVLQLLGRLEKIDHAQRDIGFYETALALLTELKKGESSGLSQLHLDQTEALLVRARQNLAEAITDYRDRLERFKLLLGRSLRAPVVLDGGIMGAFGRVFDQARSWQERPDREYRELPRIIEGLPALGEVMVEGRPILAPMGGSPDQQEEALTRAARVAIRNRGDRDGRPMTGDSADQLDRNIRHRIRRLFDLQRAYKGEQRIYEVSIRLLDQRLEQVAAPSAPGALPRSALAASGIIDLLEPETQRLHSEDRIVTIWTSFQTERLALYREVGILPYDDWKSFFSDLSTR